MAGQSGTYRGLSAEERAAGRRAQLLEATLAVWATQGDGRVTMTRICAEAGLTERYFYESFAHLDDALTAVMDAIAEEVETARHEAADGAGADPAARVRASVHAFVALVAADPRKGRVALIEAVGRPPQRARRTQLLRQFAGRAAEEVRALHGLAWSEREAELTGLLFIGGLAELVTAWLDGSLESTPDEIVEAATAMFVGRRAD